MVSQNQEDGVGWEGNAGSPSRTGSLLSLDGRQRPAPVKTPPSYYDAVRSRHSLSQPRATDGNKQDRGYTGQQVKYNSLPRPLPQRCPPATPNGQHRQWPEEHYDPLRSNSNQTWRSGDHPAPRQMYDSPPKPANHVPLQLQVHNQERYLIKRGSEQRESCSAPVAVGPRGNDQPKIIGGPRADRLTVDCDSREGNSMNVVRKDSLRSQPLCSDPRSPPSIPPNARLHPRSPPAQIEHNTNSLPRRDPYASNGLLRRCYTMTPDGAPANSNNIPRNPTLNGTPYYEPRYSKSGKLPPRPLSQGFESRPMPPPAIQLRTGPLGSYPDPETLKRCEAAMHNRNYNDPERQSQRTPHGDISKQIFVDTNSYNDGQSAITDHLAIPYRIPQVSPKNTPRPLFENHNGMNGRKEHIPGVSARGQPSPLINGIAGMKNQQLSTCPQRVDDYNNSIDRRVRRHPEGTSVQYNDDLQSYANQNSSVHAFNKHLPSPSSRSHSQISDNGVIYANHHMSFQNGGLSDLNSPHKSSPPMPNRNSVNYENQIPKNFPPNMQNISPSSKNVLYSNQLMANTRFKSNSHINQQENITHIQNFQSGVESTTSNYPDLHNAQKIQHIPPSVTQKPRPTLPQPSEMIMVTETRGWNGQVNSYPKDVVKPTPRMPRLANVASGTQLTTVPAYQCVINELSTQNVQQAFPRSSDSSTLSLKSDYDSSSSSVRDYSRQPSKSDSSIDIRKLSEGLKASGSQQRIDKSFLSASMTSLCSDASSSVSTRRPHRSRLQEDPNWDRMNEEFQKRKDKGSVFCASPWEREEKEKLQREQILDARRARDQEIAYLESVPDRSEKQEEWLRILRLEREFQRRAEQEIRDDEDEDEDDEDIIEKHPLREETDEKVENFHGDKGNTIPNERVGLKLLDDLLENSLKSSTQEAREFSKSPSDKHFIPLELTIPDRETSQSSLSLGNNILQVSDQKTAEYNNSRLSKPPIPAPRPSKATLKTEINNTDYPLAAETKIETVNQNQPESKIMESNARSLSKLEISDSFLYGSECNDGGREYQENWLIEVNSYETTPAPEPSKSTTKHNSEQNEEPRIYENIMDIQASKPKQNFLPQNEFASHTLPKTIPNNLVTKSFLAPRAEGGHSEKKFPAMGISSTLSRKFSGHAPCDSDILPTLYASSKLKNGFQKEIPSELEDKSPEFKKLWISRPEKLTFQDKIRKFSLQAGDEDVPRDRVKNSRAQREIEIKFNEGQRKTSSISET